MSVVSTFRFEQYLRNRYYSEIGIFDDGSSIRSLIAINYSFEKLFDQNDKSHINFIYNSRNLSYIS